MAITVQYGPISAALQLAKQAGAGEGHNIQAQRDLQSLALQDQIQRNINSQNSDMIRMAMEKERMNQEAQARAQAVRMENDRLTSANTNQSFEHNLQTQQLSLQTQKANEGTQEFNAQQQLRTQAGKDIATQRAEELKKKQDYDKWFASLNPEQQSEVHATGKLRPQFQVDIENRQANAAHAEVLAKEIAALRKDIVSGTPSNDPTKTPPSPEAIAAATAARKTLEVLQPKYLAAVDASAPANLKNFSTAPVNAGGSGPTPAGAPMIAPDEWMQAIQAVGPDPKKMAQWIKDNVAKVREAKANAAQPFMPAGPPAPLPPTPAASPYVPNAYDNIDPYANNNLY